MMPGLAERYLEGEVLLIDKPYGWTSFDVVNYIRNCFRHTLGLRKIKIGHAGTLDPLATGLLILCTGKATKRIEEFQGQEKEYTCRMDFSATTPSFDKETEPDARTSFSHLDAETLERALDLFRGDIEQVPPTFSAIKVKGKRAYEHARSDEEVRLLPRRLHIAEFSLLDLSLPEASFRIRCSKGTYIRALARDLGRELGCGAYLSELRREAIGSYRVDDALSPEAYCNQIRNSLT